MQDPASIAESRDALRHLSDLGFDRLLDGAAAATVPDAAGQADHQSDRTPPADFSAACLRHAGSRPRSSGLSDYVNGPAFTRLFRHRRKNHQQICEQLRLIAAGVGARFWFAQADDRQELVAEAARRGH